MLHGFGGARGISVYRESGVKVIVIRALRTPATDKGLTYFFKTLRRIDDPRPRLPRWLVAQVLRMPAGKLDDPVLRIVLVKSDDRRVS